MKLFLATRESFAQLSDLLNQLTAEQYTAVSENLSGATIGQHMRHIIELYQCLAGGYEEGIVCYDKRKRDVAIETDKDLAGKIVVDLYTGIDRANKEMTLETWHGDADPVLVSLSTNYYRELMYNLEHAIHHMALIRVGLKEFSAECIPENFGVAPSTIRHKKQCVQ
jgi:hypothetical protein